MGCVRILKDNNGKQSGYRECDGEAAYMPERQSYENIFHKIKHPAASCGVFDFCQTIVKRAIAQFFAVLSDGYAEDDYHHFVHGTIVKKDLNYPPQISRRY